MPDDQFDVEVWITKFALTKGICKAKVCRGNCNGLDSASAVNKLCYVGPSEHDCIAWHTFYGNEWHLSEYAAIERAEQMKQAKLKALMEEIWELEDRRFASLDHPYYSKVSHD